MLPNRFWSKVHKTKACWNWTGGTSKGYGIVWWEGRTVSAHRLSYEDATGPVPAGLELDHACRNRRCVRPDHLRPVEHRTNVLMGISAPAANIRKTTCENGHAYTVEQRTDGRFQRRCVECRKAGSAALWRMRERAREAA